MPRGILYIICGSLLACGSVWANLSASKDDHDLFNAPTQSNPRERFQAGDKRDRCEEGRSLAKPFRDELTDELKNLKPEERAEKFQSILRELSRRGLVPSIPVQNGDEGLALYLATKQFLRFDPKHFEIGKRNLFAEGIFGQRMEALAALLDDGDKNEAATKLVDLLAVTGMKLEGDKAEENLEAALEKELRDVEGTDKAKLLEKNNPRMDKLAKDLKKDPKKKLFGEADEKKRPAIVKALKDAIRTRPERITQAKEDFPDCKEEPRVEPTPPTRLADAGPEGKADPLGGTPGGHGSGAHGGPHGGGAGSGHSPSGGQGGEGKEQGGSGGGGSGQKPPQSGQGTPSTQKLEGNPAQVQNIQPPKFELPKKIDDIVLTQPPSAPPRNPSDDKLPDPPLRGAQAFVPNLLPYGPARQQATSRVPQNDRTIVRGFLRRNPRRTAVGDAMAAGQPENDLLSRARALGTF